MEDDVRRSSADRYAVSQAYRWRAERDQARQELREVQARLICDEKLRLRALADKMDVSDLVADLIEPSCDRDALLALADKMDERAPYGWYSGERDSLRDYARRIREALGVVE